MPCYKLAVRFGRDDMVKRFLASGRSGFYLSVLSEGDVAAGGRCASSSPSDPGDSLSSSSLCGRPKECAGVTLATDRKRVVAVVGKEAIRRYVTEGFALPGFSIQWQTTDFVVSASGDMAYGVGANKVTINGPQGDLLTEHGRGLTVWRKTPGGGWKCVIDMWNAEPSASPAR